MAGRVLRDSKGRYAGSTKGWGRGRQGRGGGAVNAFGRPKKGRTKRTGVASRNVAYAKAQVAGVKTQARNVRSLARRIDGKRVTNVAIGALGGYAYAGIPGAVVGGAISNSVTPRRRRR